MFIVLCLIFLLLLSFFSKNTEFYEDSIILLNSQKIPKRIFQTWKSKTDIPENMAYWHSSWKKYNPDYIFDLWDDQDNRNFIKDKFSWFLHRYDSYDINIKRVDAVRYFYLYYYGGIYVDMDFECLKNFDEIILNGDAGDVILGRMNFKDDGVHNQHNIPNAIMISKPRQEFWIVVFHLLLTNNAKNQTEYVTGPAMLKEAFTLYINNTLKIYDEEWFQDILIKLDKSLQPVNYSTIIEIKNPHIFYPIDWTDEDLRDEELKNSINTDYSKKFPDSFACTFWTHSWEDNSRNFYY